MVPLQVGFFPAFKSNDTLLVDGDAEGLRWLASPLRKLAMGEQNLVAFRDLRFVEIHQGLEILAACGKRDAGAAFQRPGVITWTRSREGWEEAVDKIAVLVDHATGHQYLDHLSDVTVMASTGEYGDTWWQQHARRV